MQPAYEMMSPDIFRTAVEAAPCAMIVVSESGIITLVNRETERLFDHARDALIGRHIEVLVPDEARDRHASNRGAFAAQPAARPMGGGRDLLARRRDGTVIPVEIGLSPVASGGSLVVVCTIVDLSERKRAEERILEQAEALAEANKRLTELAATDSLTSLWNRRAFLDQLDIQLQQAVRSARPLSVLILDLDHFKDYNDTYGHLAGDEVLKLAARLLHDRSRRSDFVARIGGEELGIILPEADRDGSVVLGERFRVAIQSAQWPRRDITVSIGAATVAFRAAVPRPDAPDRTQLLAAADRALYRSKARGRNRVTHVDEVETGPELPEGRSRSVRGNAAG
jgi:diguanylate cyclase (GGDEF)-like protein/PAS domain S-box-containing protein